jgi:2-polyprenyl-6-methoxyphenol hydroxylase-like FAD-dependent oxidoreductase
VRRHLGFETAINYSGYVSWRGITKFRHSWLREGEAMEGWGAGQRIGIVPLRDGRTYWYATANLPEPPHETPPISKQQFLQMFGDWILPFRDMVTETETIVEAPIFDRQPKLPWARGRAVLIGDAAHPTTPNLGQGACMALEDSVVLARCLRHSADLAAGLQQFESERHPRCSRIVRSSRMLGAIGQWHNPVAVRIRNFLTSIRPHSSLQRSMNFIHAYEPSLSPK